MFRTVALLLLILALSVTLPAGLISQEVTPGNQVDEIEFLNGTKLEGQVTSIDTTGKKVTFRATINGKPLLRTYNYSSIHAVRYKGKRYILTAKTTKPASLTAKQKVQQIGPTEPDWLASAQLNTPATLDMNWPIPAPKPWNNQKNIGQFIWDVINPNERRWPGGIKLMYELMERHKNNSATLVRVKKSLASMYFRFFQDYARAAYWWEDAGVVSGTAESIHLADCYYRLGDKPAAIKIMTSRTLRPGMIKLYGDMNMLPQALDLARRYINVGGRKHIALLHAGDACRLAGKYQQAIGYYEQVVQTPVPENNGRAKQTVRRARDNIAALKLFELLDLQNIKDGTYTDRSMGYAGDIVIELTVAKGKLTDLKVAQHQEKQFYSAINDTPRQILEKQAVKGVDAVSGATITSEAIINASAKALNKGQQ